MTLLLSEKFSLRSPHLWLRQFGDTADVRAACCQPLRCVVHRSEPLQLSAQVEGVLERKEEEQGSRSHCTIMIAHIWGLWQQGEVADGISQCHEIHVM